MRTEGPNREEFELAKVYAAGRRVLAFEDANAVARHAPSQTVVFGQDIHPDVAIQSLVDATFEVVARSRAGLRAAFGRVRRRPFRREFG